MKRPSSLSDNKENIMSPNETLSTGGISQQQSKHWQSIKEHRPSVKDITNRPVTVLSAHNINNNNSTTLQTFNRHTKTNSLQTAQFLTDEAAEYYFSGSRSLDTDK